MVVAGVGVVGINPVDHADVVRVKVQIHPYLEVFPPPDITILMLSQALCEQCELTNVSGHLRVLQSLKDMPHLILTRIDSHGTDPLSMSPPGAVVDIRPAIREAEKVGVAVDLL